jgi:hypothetical protein
LPHKTTDKQYLSDIPNQNSILYAASKPDCCLNYGLIADNLFGAK